MSRTVESFDDELMRRHRTATMAIYAVFALTAALIALSFTDILEGLGSIGPVMDVPLRIGIVLLGLGAIALRRARFAAPRLQAVASLRGASGLLATLQHTTIIVAVIAALIALAGLAHAYL